MPNGRDLFNQSLLRAVEPWGTTLDSETLALLWDHFQTILDANQRMNLTRITDPVQAAVQHYADSLALLAWATESRTKVTTMLDVGTGAGFPAIPVAVVRPDWSIVALDATRKKVDFLRQSCNALGIRNVTLVHAHSTHWPTRQKFDLVVSRAVARLGPGIRDSARFVSRGGRLITFKSLHVATDELEDGKKAADSAGLMALDPFKYQLEIGPEAIERKLVIFQPRI